MADPNAIRVALWDLVCDNELNREEKLERFNELWKGLRNG